MPVRSTSYTLLLILVIVSCLGASIAVLWKWQTCRRDRPTSFKGYVHEHSGDPEQRGHPHGTGTLTRAEVTSILEDYDKRIADDPGNGALISEKIHFAVDHDPEKAIATCRELLEYSPDSEFLMSHLVIAYLQRGTYDKALHYALRCVAKRKNVDNLLLLGQIYYQTRVLDKAEEVYEQVLEIEPGNEQAKAGIEYILELRSRKYKPDL